MTLTITSEALDFAHRAIANLKREIEADPNRLAADIYRRALAEYEEDLPLLEAEAERQYRRNA